jgi:hypothetical protein
VKKPIIVGYDPGTTAALAILDSRGRVLFLKSKRGFKKGEILSIITHTGKPLIVAGDRSPLPKSVEKLASTLGCKPFHPKNSLTNVEKERIIREFAKEVKDDHEKDALASALHAFKSYSRFFRRIETTLASKGLNELYDKVIESIMLGKAENITEAINQLTRAEKKPPKIEKIERKRDLEKTLMKLRRKIEQLERDVLILKESNQNLKRKLKLKEEKIRHLRKKLDEKVNLGSLWLMRKKLDRLKSDLEEMKSLTEKLRLFRKLELKGYVPIIEMEETRDSIAKDLNRTVDLEERVVFVKCPENAQILNDYRIKALIVSNKPSEKMLEKVNFPVIAEKDISIENIKSILVTKKEELEEEIKKARKLGFVQWLKSHRKRKF